MSGWGPAGEYLVVLIVAIIVVGFLATIYDEWKIARADRAQAKERREAGAREEQERAVERQRALLKIADDVVSAPLKDRMRLMREAESLGFLDEDEGPKLAS